MWIKLAVLHGFLVLCIHKPLVNCTVMGLAPVQAVRLFPPIGSMKVKTYSHIWACEYVWELLLWIIHGVLEGFALESISLFTLHLRHV